MNHAATGRHPLHATAFQQSFMTGIVAVAHAPGDHVGHCLEAPVRMVGEAGDVVVGRVAAEGVEHQEGIESVLQGLRQHTRQLDAGAVGRGVADDQLLDRARLCDRFGVADGLRGHGGSSKRVVKGVQADVSVRQTQRRDRLQPVQILVRRIPAPCSVLRQK